jgi:hypothetical protein
VRPFVVAAVLRGVSFDATRYKSFIDLQVHLLAWLVKYMHSLMLITAAVVVPAWPAPACVPTPAGEVAPEPVPAAQSGVCGHARPGDAEAALHVRGAAPRGHLLRAPEAGQGVSCGRAARCEYFKREVHCLTNISSSLLHFWQLGTA